MLYLEAVWKELSESWLDIQLPQLTTQQAQTDTVFLKKFLTCQTLCLRPIDLISDIVLYLSDIESI